MADGGGHRALVLTLLVVAACSSSSSDSNDGGGARGGDAGTTSGNGGDAGSSSGGTGLGGSGTSGDSGSASGGLSGAAGSASGGSSGSAGSASGEAGRGGDAGSSSGGAAGTLAGGGGRSGAGGATSCARDEDCVVAQTYSNTGCCSRGCGVALNADFVENDPCSTTDSMTDPVPASCNTGCTPCPQDPRCPTVHAAICVSGTCTAVTDYGPCTDNADCVLGIDYKSQLGACCGCPTVTSQATIDNAPCVVPVSAPEPQGCEPSPPDICASTSCPITCNTPMNLRCDAGRCASG